MVMRATARTRRWVPCGVEAARLRLSSVLRTHRGQLLAPVPAWDSLGQLQGARVVGWLQFTERPMKRVLILCLLCTPVYGQSYWPNLAGQRYCDLRAVGVTHEQALPAAIRENWSDTRPPAPTVTVEGQDMTLDTIDLARWVARCR
jgi:hypothetical protein